MNAALLALLHLAVAATKLCRPDGVRAVIAENLLPKQQLIVLRRARQRAPNLTVGDRVLCRFGSLCRRPRRVRKVAIGPRPSTLLAFHRALARRKYRRLFASSQRLRKPGPKGPSEAIIRAIVELKSHNPRCGCPRIARIISQTFGVDIDKNLVRRVLAKHYRLPRGGSGPSWLSFIGHTADSLWSVDLFRRESIVIQSYWVLLVMDQFTRHLIGLGVHHGDVDAPSLWRMFNHAIRGQGVPRHLSTDHDPLFEPHRWQRNLRVLEVDEIKTVPYVRLSHRFIERLIGTMRREYLDHVLFWNARDLERKLADWSNSRWRREEEFETDRSRRLTRLPQERSPPARRPSRRRSRPRRRSQHERSERPADRGHRARGEGRNLTAFMEHTLWVGRGPAT